LDLIHDHTKSLTISKDVPKKDPEYYIDSYHTSSNGTKHSFISESKNENMNQVVWTSVARSSF